ncbi:hypothetical protein BH11PSE11_BH11PSE11_20600 [soil metagenome]
MYDVGMSQRKSGSHQLNRNNSFSSLAACSWRRVAAGIGLSLLLHATMVFFALRISAKSEGESVHSSNEALIVHLSQEAKPGSAVPPLLRRKADPAPLPRRHPVTVLPRPTVPRRPEPAVEIPESVPEAPVAVTQPPTDITTLINAARERRNAAGRDQGDNQRGATADDVIAANINHSLQTQSRAFSGTNGVFQILHMGPRMAEFSFRGWKSDSGRDWKQVIAVDAGPHGDVELAVVQRMIQLIRSHFSGDFNWESHRLHRMMVLSARVDDNAALEDFMMREFFSVAK